MDNEDKPGEGDEEDDMVVTFGTNENNVKKDDIDNSNVVNPAVVEHGRVHSPIKVSENAKIANEHFVAYYEAVLGSALSILDTASRLSMWRLPADFVEFKRGAKKCTEYPHHAHLLLMDYNPSNPSPEKTLGLGNEVFRRLQSQRCTQKIAVLIVGTTRGLAALASANNLIFQLVRAHTVVDEYEPRVRVFYYSTGVKNVNTLNAAVDWLRR